MRHLLVFAALAVECSTGVFAAQPADTALPYLTERAFDLKFDQPVAMVTPPGEKNRLFVVEKSGVITVIPDLARPAKHVFLDLTGSIGDSSGEQGVLALAFHPDYARNGLFFVWHTRTGKAAAPRARVDQLSRFRVSASDPNTADRDSELVLIAQEDEASNHNGGELLFGPDGYLYLSLGDEGGANDQYRNSQRIDKDFFSGILRLDVDKKAGSLAPNPHPSVHREAYAVPADNPFVGATTFNGVPVDPARVHTEFWAVGLRNPWRMSFDPATGRLWCGDVGQNLHEEIDLIVRGGNYGWNFREGNFPFRGTPPAGAKFTDPIWDYPHSQGLSITGGLVYHGKLFPELEGKYLFADYAFGRLWALTPDGDKPVGADRVQLIARAEAIVAFGRDPRNDEVLLASFSAGRILRLVRAPKAAK